MSLPDMWTAAVFSRPPNGLVGKRQQVEKCPLNDALNVPLRSPAFDASLSNHSKRTRAHVPHQSSNWQNIDTYTRM
jgi:hypothetical protein